MTTVGERALANLAAFVRALKRSGFAVSIDTTHQLAEAAQLVGLDNPRDVREAFRSLAVTTRAQESMFDALFDTFFTGDEFVSLDAVLDTFEQQREAYAAPRIGAKDAERSMPTGDEQEVYEVMGGSAIERLMEADFGDLTKEESDAVASLLENMTWSVSSHPSRRWRPARSGEVRNLRRTLRSMTGPQRDLIPLAYSERRHRQRPLIVLADISGSMQRYSEMLLHFIHGAQFRFHRVEAFVFATRLTRITRQLRRRDPRLALQQVADRVPDWSSGTRIGEAFDQYNRHWSRRVGGNGPIVLVISDGWDTGDPDLLSREMRRLRRSVHRIIWLNPLAGRDGFAPEARGMAAALPFVDDLVAGGTARNLEELIVLLQDSQRSKGAAVA